MDVCPAFFYFSLSTSSVSQSVFLCVCLSFRLTVRPWICLWVRIAFAPRSGRSD